MPNIRTVYRAFRPISIDTRTGIVRHELAGSARLYEDELEAIESVIETARFLLDRDGRPVQTVYPDRVIFGLVQLKARLSPTCTLIVGHVEQAVLHCKAPAAPPSSVQEEPAITRDEVRSIAEQVVADSLSRRMQH